MSSTLPQDLVNLPLDRSLSRNELMRETAGADTDTSLFSSCDGTCLIDAASGEAGIGAVTMGGHVLRSTRRAMFANVTTPDGIELVDWHEFERTPLPDGGTKIRYQCSARASGVMEWMVHAVRPRVRTDDWSMRALPLDPQDTSLALVIRPVTRTIDGRACSGFSYQYRYSSRSHPVYKIVDRSTWEPGGCASGNELWVRNCFVAPVFAVRSVEDAYSTEWYLPSAVNPNVFQFMPWQSGLQGFSMTAHPTGCLVTWATRPAHIRSLFEKRPGSDEVAHWHEHCGDLSNELETAPIEVLWFAGETDRRERFNLYDAVAEHVADALHAAAGLRRDRVTTYGVIEEWGHADLRLYREKGLPKLLAAGTRTVFLANHFANNQNVYGVSNMCCTVDWQVPPSVGASELAAFCDSAAAGGASVEMWGNTAISTLAFMAHRPEQSARPILPLGGYRSALLDALQSSADPFVRNPSNAIEADHYSPVFACLNLRDPTVRTLWRQAWAEANQRLGLRGLFLDSSFNLSSDKHHWVASAADGSRAHGATADQVHLRGSTRPLAGQEPPAAVLTQYHAHLELIREMQQMGYAYCGEDIGVFGVHRCGPAMEVALQTSPMWTDCIATFDAKAVRDAGGDPDDLFFRALACRMMWMLHYNVSGDALTWRQNSTDAADAPTPLQLSLLKAFNTVEADMYARTLLANDRGVLYQRGGRGVLWSFCDFSYDLLACTGVAVTDVLSGKSVEVDAGAFAARAHRVYVIGPSDV